MAASASQSESLPAPELPIFIAVEHPGRVQSVERAILGLGGSSAMKRLADDPINAPLELRFRPMNRFEHPVQSASAKTNNLIIRVRKQVDDKGHVLVQHEAVGIVKCTRRFRDLCDFQWTTKNSPFVKRLEKAAAAKSEMGQFTLGPEEDPQSKDLDILPPPIFSSTVVQHAYNYKQNPAAKKIQTDAGLRFVNRARGIKQHLQTISFADRDVPTQPSAKLSSKPTEDIRALIESLNVIFEERPMWTRRGLNNRLSEESNIHNLKFAIPYVAYMWKSGPWRDCYVKFGLDPRSDNAYAKYQAIYCINRATQTLEEGTEVTPNDSHIFDGRTLYPTGRTFMFIDMTDPLLAQMWQQAPKRPIPHERDGWFYANMITASRATLKGKITSLCNGTVPSDLEFTELLRLASEPDAIKDDEAPVTKDREFRDSRIPTGGKDVAEESDRSQEDVEMAEDDDDVESDDNDDDDDDDGDNEDEEDDLDQRVEALVSGMFGGTEQQPRGSLNGQNSRDAFDDIDAGIYGQDE